MPTTKVTRCRTRGGPGRALVHSLFYASPRTRTRALCAAISAPKMHDAVRLRVGIHAPLGGPLVPLIFGRWYLARRAAPLAARQMVPRSSPCPCERSLLRRPRARVCPRYFTFCRARQATSRNIPYIYTYTRGPTVGGPARVLYGSGKTSRNVVRSRRATRTKK